LLILLLTSCSTLQKEQPTSDLYFQSTEDRNNQLNAINRWTVFGKIAFIQTKKRESASLNWKVNENSQQLNLTSYLGINVLHLVSDNDNHQLKVDGKTYQSDNLDNLIYSLTGLNFPTNALAYWIKGLPFDKDDKLTYSEVNQLPQTLESYYQQKVWKIQYKNYRNINGNKLPTSLLIKHSDLTIRIAINQWIIN